MRKGFLHNKKIKAIVTAIAFFVCFGLNFFHNYMPADADEDIVVSIVAHRGYSGYYPENTLSSFAGAVRIGAERIEFDVRKTADDRLVVFHDDTLERYGGDSEREFIDYTYEELLTYDVSLDMGREFALERIPTLEQTLSLIATTDCDILLELKDIGEDENFAREVYDVCSQYQVLDRIIFGSFNYSYLQDIKDINCDCPIMVFASFGKSTLPKKYPAEYYGINMKTVTPATIKAVHAAGANIYSYGPKNRYQILCLQRMGVDGIITDYPNFQENML